MSFEETIIGVLDKYPFYGYVLLDLPRKYTTDIPTAAVALDEKKKIFLLVNPEFFGSIEDNQKTAVVIHEILHLVLRHLTRIGDRDKKIWGISADCVVNQYLPFVDDKWGIITIPMLEKQFNIKIPSGETVEYYYDLFKQHVPPDMEITLSFGDNHDGWSELTETQKEILEKEFDVMLKDAFQKARGIVPGNLSSVIKEIMNPTLPWEAILHKFLQFSRKTTRMFTKKKLSKRFDTIPGERNTDQFKLVVGIDTSGSVSNENLQSFAEELYGIAKFPNTEITVVEADAQIQQIYPFKRGFKMGHEFLGRGGTEFQSVVNYAVEKKADALVYLTDGGAPDPDVPKRLRLLWVLTKNHEPKRTGRSIVMDK